MAGWRNHAHRSFFVCLVAGWVTAGRHEAAWSFYLAGSCHTLCSSLPVSSCMYSIVVDCDAGPSPGEFQRCNAGSSSAVN